MTRHLVSCNPARGESPAAFGWRGIPGACAAPRLLVLVAAICSVTPACSQDAPEEIETETVVPVTTEAVETGSIRAVIHATGVVEPAPGADLTVTAPEAARIVEITKAEGDAVRRGELLVRFEIPTLSADTAARRAEIERAQARLPNARAAQTRAHDLFERGVAARKEVEDTDRELSDAETALVEAQASLAASAMLASRSIVHASFDGVIAKRSHNPGDLVEPSSSDPILRVIDPRRLEVRAAVPLADIPGIAIGAPVRVLVSADSPPRLAKVISRPAAVEPGTAAAPVRIQFAAPPGLPAGTPVQVEIDAEERAGVTLVPASALVHEGPETAVFIAAGGKAQRRAVTTGLADADHVEVRSGVKPGELVITHGQAGLPDGAPISVAAAEK